MAVSGSAPSSCIGASLAGLEYKGTERTDSSPAPMMGLGKTLPVLDAAALAEDDDWVCCWGAAAACDGTCVDGPVRRLRAA